METPKAKKCKFCQSEIPQKASVCPQCGRKQGGKAKWIIAVIVVLLIFSALAGGGEKPASSGENPPGCGKQHTIRYWQNRRNRTCGNHGSFSCGSAFLL